MTDFEKWAKSRGWNISKSSVNPDLYHVHEVNLMCRAWEKAYKERAEYIAWLEANADPTMRGHVRENYLTTKGAKS